MSELCQRLYRLRVLELPIKAAFVDMPMTADFAKGLLRASPEQAAQDISHAMERGRSVCYTPWVWRWMMLLIRDVPEQIFVRRRY